MVVGDSVAQTERRAYSAVHAVRPVEGGLDKLEGGLVAAAGNRILRRLRERKEVERCDRFFLSLT